MQQVGAGAGGRRHELDWLRVIVTLNLVAFHAAWLITSVPGFSEVERFTPFWIGLGAFVELLSPLHMYILFFVAGAATGSSLRSRSAGQFLRERVGRLLLPLGMFMVFLFPLLAWFWPTDEDLSGTKYLTEFWPYCLFNCFYFPPTGRPTWGHLWFVAYLFLYGLLLLPLRPLLARVTGPVNRLLTGSWGSMLLGALPIVLTFALLAPLFPFFRLSLYTDWGYFAYNLTAFLSGYLLMGRPEFVQVCRRRWLPVLGLGLVLSAGKMALEFWAPAWSRPAWTLTYQLYAILAGLNTWVWVVAVMGLATRFLSTRNGFLRHASRISYPFYIFHMLPLVVGGRYITALGLPVAAEFALLLLVAYPATWLCAELARSTTVTRVFLGIKG